MSDYTHTISSAALREVCPSLPPGKADELAKAIGTAMHRFQPGIGERAAAHFVAQCAHETGEFRWLRELWGPTPTQAGYWKRRELQGLGLLTPALGYLYRGGGFIQTTGRVNFRRAAQRLGRRSALKLAAQSGTPRVAALLAAIWWADHFPASMRHWTVEKVSERVNGRNPANGLEERRTYTERAMRVRRRLVPQPIK